MRFKSILGLLALGLASRFQVARADSFGVSAIADAITAVPLSGTILQEINTGGLLPQRNYNIGPGIGSDQSTTYFDPSPNANGLFTSTASAHVYSLSVTDGLLRGWVKTLTGDLDVNTIALTGGTASGTLNWVDTIPVEISGLGGLPLGTPVLLVVTNHLAGVFTASGLEQAFLFSNTSVGNAIFSNTYEFGLPGGLNNAPQGGFDVNQIEIIDSFVGATLNVEEQLSFETSGEGDSFGSVNAVNTAFLNIQPLTPGITLIGASGIDYSKVGESTNAVPEPTAVVLLSTGLLVLVGMDWRRRFSSIR